MKKDQRLVELFVPSHYELSFNLDSQKLKYQGQARISGRLLKISDHILLHSKGLNIEQVSVDAKGVEAKFSLDEENGLLKIDFGQNLKPTELNVEITFDRDITESMVGVYPSYYELNGQKQTIISTQFESHYAREAFPCVDEPLAKATFQLTIERDKQFTALSNTDPIKNKNTAKRKLTIFDKTPVMSTYLVAFTVGKLDYIEARTKRDIRVRIYSTPLQKSHLEFAKEIAVTSLDMMEEFYGHNYELNKCDLLALPDFASGAMENWGLCIFRETALVFDEQRSSLAAKKMVAQVIVHELAHQWFGNLVTMKWWDDLWLKESFARFMESYITDKIFPEWKLWEDFVANDFVYAQNLDRLESTHPIKLDLPRAEDIRSKYDAISYDKGSAVLRMLYIYVGEEDYIAGLRAYIAKHKYGNAQASDLWQALETVSSKDTTSFMKAWTSNTGFPMLEVELKNKQVSYKQSRYSVAELADNQLWPIPVFGSDQDLATDAEGQFNIQKVGYLNSDHGGFYITKYAEKYRQAVLRTDMNDTEITGLINDSLHLAISGHQETAALTAMLPEFMQSESLAIQESVADSLAAIKRSHIFEEHLDIFNDYRISLYEPLYKQYGWQMTASDSLDKQQIRPLVLGALVASKYKPALDEALKQFKDFEHVAEIDPNLLAIVLSAGARHLGEKGLKELDDLLDRTDSPHAVRIIQSAMTATEDEKVIKKLFTRLEDGTIRLQDIPSQLFGLLANRKANAAAWQWLQANWDELRSRFGGDIMSVGNLPKMAAATLVTQQGLKEYDAFFAKADTSAIDDKVEQGRDALMSRLDWQSRDQKKLIEWLNNRLD